ncbi:MAG: hypothetical protein Q7T41_03495 [Candidatus Saccharibacteria bacterium]|nr:hypothetical protein [Candidatus Saccharibacteria bacterium]
MSERTGIIERVVKRVLPVAAVAGLALSACGEDKQQLTPEQQIVSVHEDAVKVCSIKASADFATQYPDIIIGNNGKNPTLEELKAAEAAITSRETEGPSFIQGQYDDCMRDNFDNVVAELDHGTIVPQPDSSVVNETIVTQTT